MPKRTLWKSFASTNWIMWGSYPSLSVTIYYYENFKNSSNGFVSFAEGSFLFKMRLAKHTI